MDRALVVIAKQLGFRAVARDVVEDDDVSSYVVVKLRRFYEKNSKNTDALARLLVNVLTMLPRSTAENIEHHIGVVAYMGLDATDDEFDDGVEDENERHGYEVYGKDPYRIILRKSIAVVFATLGDTLEDCNDRVLIDTVRRVLEKQR